MWVWLARDRVYGPEPGLDPGLRLGLGPELGLGLGIESVLGLEGLLSSSLLSSSLLFSLCLFLANCFEPTSKRLPALSTIDSTTFLAFDLTNDTVVVLAEVVAVAVGILLVVGSLVAVLVLVETVETVVWLVVVGLVNISSVGHVLVNVLVWATRVVG